MFYVKRNFSFNTNIFPIDNIFIIEKLIEIFYNRTYMRKRPVSHILLTVWSIKIIFFSLFVLHSELSLVISIFFHYFVMNDLNAYDSQVMMRELHCGG